MARRKKKIEEPKIGHNGGPLTEERKRQLAGYISEIERIEGEVAAQNTDKKIIYQSVKDAGYSTKAIREVVRQRKTAKAEREAFEAMVDVYKHALGMLADTELGQAAIARRREELKKGAFEAIAGMHAASMADAPFHAPDGPAPAMPDKPAMPA